MQIRNIRILGFLVIRCLWNVNLTRFYGLAEGKYHIRLLMFHYSSASSVDKFGIYLLADLYSYFSFVLY